MNEIKVVFSQKLDIEPAEFVAVWNDTPECREIVEAQLSQQTKTQFADPLSAAVGFVGGAIAGGALYDGVKVVVFKINKKIKNLKFKEIKQDDGSIVTKVLPDKDDSPPSE